MGLDEFNNYLKMRWPELDSKLDVNLQIFDSIKQLCDIIGMKHPNGNDLCRLSLDRIKLHLETKYNE